MEGLLEFNVMSFGLSNDSATCQRTLNIPVLRCLRWEVHLFYLNNVVVFSTSVSEHLNCLRTIPIVSVASGTATKSQEIPLWA